MASLELAGVGVWSEQFADWEQFAAIARGGRGCAVSGPPAERIHPRDRRRAPLFVRMGVEVMDQACRMANVEASSVATVFGSSLGDVEITDYICSTVATEPRSLSPTRFHNSVANACTGYWSIATGSHGPASAVSAYDRSPAIALLEGAIQAVEESVPVVVAFQEVRATRTFQSIFPARCPLAAALLLTSEHVCPRSLGTLSLELEHGSHRSGRAPPFVPELGGNFAASILDLLMAVAASGSYMGSLPVSDASTLTVAYSPRRPAG